MDDQTSILVAAQVRDPGDPAIDHDHPAAQLRVSEHDRTRSPDSLTALRECLLPGRELWQYHLTALTLDGLVWATEGTDPNGIERTIRAFCLSCFLVVAPDGVRHVAPMLTDRETPQAKREWAGTIQRMRGMNVVREMGALALRRAEVTSEVADPYSRLPGAPRLAL